MSSTRKAVTARTASTPPTNQEQSEGVLTKPTERPPILSCPDSYAPCLSQRRSLIVVSRFVFGPLRRVWEFLRYLEEDVLERAFFPVSARR